MKLNGRVASLRDQDRLGLDPIKLLGCRYSLEQCVVITWTDIIKDLQKTILFPHLKDAVSKMPAFKFPFLL